MEFDQALFDLCDLLHGSLEGTLTEVQQKQLDQWLEASDVNRQLLTELQQRGVIQRELQFFHRLNMQQGWEKVATATGHEVADVQVETPKPGIRHISWLWWAAAIFVLCSLAVPWLFRSVVQHRPPAAIATVAPSGKQDVLPGSNKATLRLANGSVIALQDTAPTQTIKEQDGTRITGSKGQLVYNNDKAGGEEVWNTLNTPRGGQYQLILPDGSKVWLNAAASLKYPTRFTGENRQVFLSGEAYFEIATDEQHPFIVKTNEHPIDIAVLGTSFNVNAYADAAAVVTLVDGAVNIKSGRQQSRLLPGQQAVLERSGGRLITTVADVETATAWKNGMFAFKQAGITEIMQQVSRWYDVEVVFAGKVPTRRFSGHIRRQATLSQFLQMLELAGHVQFTIADRKVIVK